MEVVFKDKALDDIKFWKKSGQKTIQNRISKLIEDILQHPTIGLGKPEPLKYELSGLWSREIDKGNRLIYEIVGLQLHVISMRGHYYDK
ncbi:Txe/YoeB family addiction module toxin [Haliscomenobacter sp.]|uniref:Txe/YoeB family addiction module toxin n=1 Tax=Haliscomenobacter sp. TaxID=2717303 RepID=UPI003593742E